MFALRFKRTKQYDVIRMSKGDIRIQHNVNGKFV